jgi:chromosomal replication initiation ATPase DnaA
MTPRERNMADISQIALRHGLTHHDVLGRSRTAKVMVARREAYQLLRSRGQSYPQIGALFGRHHTTVMDAMGDSKKARLYPSFGASAGLI